MCTKTRSIAASGTAGAGEVGTRRGALGGVTNRHRVTVGNAEYNAASKQNVTRAGGVVRLLTENNVSQKRRGVVKSHF